MNKARRRRILAAGLLIGTVFWITSIFAVPDGGITRLNYLTTHPEIRWMKGGSFFLLAVSAASLLIDTAYEKLLPQLQDSITGLERVFRDPIMWLILALLTQASYIQNLMITVTDLFVVLYLTAYQVNK